MLFSALCALLALTSLDSVYAGPLSLRAGGPIWGSSGAPSVDDLKQTTTPDCGFMSVLGAIVHVNPNWLGSKVTVEGSVGSATSVSIQMYDPSSRAPKTVVVSHDEQEAWNGNRNDVWWPGAFEHGGVKVGLPAGGGRLGPVLPGDSMQALTGLPSDGKMNPTADEIFDFALKAKAQNTPMVWQTPGDGSRVLVGGHAYGFFGGSGSGADRMVTLFNPWGSTQDYKLSDVAGDCYLVWFFKNYDTFTGGGGGGGGDGDRPSPSPSPTTRPPPINAVDANTWRETNRVTETTGNLVVIKEMVTVHVQG